MRIAETNERIEEFHGSIRENPVDTPAGYKYWINKERTVLVQSWPASLDGHRHVAILHRSKVAVIKTRRRPYTAYELIPWTSLRPALLVERSKAILVALDLVGHLVRLKSEEPSMMATTRLLGQVASMYGWDGTEPELKLTPGHHEARRLAVQKGEE